MMERLYLLFVRKLNKVCGVKDDNLVYSLVPSIDFGPDSVKGIHMGCLENVPLIVDSSLSIFAGKKCEVPKSSYVYSRINGEKEDIFNRLALVKDSIGIKEVKACYDNASVALSVVSSIYLNAFFRPVQFFLPHSSLFSGHWEFWDKVNYIRFAEKISNKEVIRQITQSLADSSIWSMKFRPEDFPEIVKRRLTKEDSFNKNLDPNALIKAMIIRMGELAEPSIKYEIIDFCIRSFFTYLKVGKYMRIDREIMFLRKFEEEFKKILSSLPYSK